ncbi:hypothetical protein M405DRAFT_181291 [Rhizopogon salebrosus TDB-379]|nr:hypothetical protein M405DRAFT_181291 [Rhizopogon salebrosus TDB-379]
MSSSAQGVGAKFKRFQILVVGRANAGKTTLQTLLLRKVYNATGKPKIFDAKGNKINADVMKPSVDRGYHDIKMNWCSEATLVSSFMTRADSKLEVKMNSRR